MVNRNLIRELDLGDELEQELDLAMGGSDAADFDVGQAPSLAINSVVEGKILRVDDEFVLVDVGYKSEGHIPRNEWDETEPGPEVGDVIKVLLEDIEENIVDEHRGLITLSKRKARRIEDWLRVMSSVREDDVVTGFGPSKKSKVVSSLTSLALMFFFQLARLISGDPLTSATIATEQSSALS